MEIESKGKRIVVILCVIECLLSIVNMLFSLGTASSNPITDIVRTLLTIGLYVCIYKGFNWARILTAILMSISAFSSIFLTIYCLGSIGKYPEMSYLAIQSIIYLVFYTIGAIILFSNDSIKALRR